MRQKLRWRFSDSALVLWIAERDGLVQYAEHMDLRPVKSSPFAISLGFGRERLSRRGSGKWMKRNVCLGLRPPHPNDQRAGSQGGLVSCQRHRQAVLQPALSQCREVRSERLLDPRNQKEAPATDAKAASVHGAPGAPKLHRKRKRQPAAAAAAAATGANLPTTTALRALTLRLLRPLKPRPFAPPAAAKIASCARTGPGA